MRGDPHMIPDGNIGCLVYSLPAYLVVDPMRIAIANIDPEGQHAVRTYRHRRTILCHGDRGLFDGGVATDHKRTLRVFHAERARLDVTVLANDQPMGRTTKSNSQVEYPRVRHDANLMPITLNINGDPLQERPSLMHPALAMNAAAIMAQHIA